VTTGCTIEAKRNMIHITHHDLVLNCISSTNLLGLIRFQNQNKIVANTSIAKMIAITHCISAIRLTELKILFLF
jgi:hypothetical protein